MTSAPSSDHLYSTFQPDRLHALGDDELDALPYGVIGLDASGIIVRYNLAEARFARLDRAQVLGRSFFEEIAKCTASPDFFGRFEQIKSGSGPATVRFPFLFAFRFGAQSVDVDMGRTEDAALVYLCVNRRRFLPRQKDVPPAIEAAVITQLEPGASSQGVVRDSQARRRVEAEVTMFEALFASIAKRDKAGAAALLRDFGTTWGRLAVVDLETDVLEARGKTLCELPMADAMDVVAGFVHRQRLGRVSIDFGAARRGALLVRIERSAFAEVPGVAGCAAFEGLFGAILSHLAGRPIVAREARCRAGGAPACELVAVSSARLAVVERAVSGRTRSVSAVLDAIAVEVAP